MAHIFTLTNAKGGCGKTTVVLNLAVCFAKAGYRTLAIDLDQQGNLSAGLGVNLNKLNSTAHRLLTNEASEIRRYLVEIRPQLHLLPNSIDIEADDLLEAKKVNRELLLRRQLKPVLPDFDVVIIDTPPAMRAATVSALVVADSVIIPIDSSSFALLGMNQLLKTIAAISETHNPSLKINVLTTLFNKRQNLDKIIRQKVEEFFGPSLVLESVIHRYVGVAEATAMVKGELRVPNTINFSLFPTLDPFAKAVYYQLFLLSHGFRHDTCVVGLAKLAKSVLMSQRKVQDTITYLEKRGLIRRLRAILGGPSKGNVYQVPIPAADMAPGATSAGGSGVAEHAATAPYATVAPKASAAVYATNKDDDDYKMQSSSKGRAFAVPKNHVENHSGAAAPRERQENPDGDFARVRTAYEHATGNLWNKSDSAVFHENGLDRIPVDKIISVLETITRRTPTKINSFRYYLKEILAVPDRRSRAWRKKQLEKIVLRIRDNSVGRADYSSIDFLEDVKSACAREAVPFDDDLFNELAG